MSYISLFPPTRNALSSHIIMDSCGSGLGMWVHITLGQFLNSSSVPCFIISLDSSPPGCSAQSWPAKFSGLLALHIPYVRLCLVAELPNFYIPSSCHTQPSTSLGGLSLKSQEAIEYSLWFKECIFFFPTKSFPFGGLFRLVTANCIPLKEGCMCL